MFSFLTPKPFLRDLLPSGYVDIHSHLLPGIDDGAKDMEATRTLTAGLHELGITDAITTPHVMRNVWDNSTEKINRTLQETKTAGLPPGFSIRAAAEYLIDDHFMQLYAARDLLTLKDNFVLVEMSYLNPPLQLMEILFDLQVAGYQPVLAHPERYLFYHTQFAAYGKLKNAGCLFQLNLLSVTGYYGSSVRATAEKLLKRGLIDFTGTDLHHSKHLESLSRRTLIKDIAPLRQAMANNATFAI